MKSPSATLDAEAFFGSAARRDGDLLSDLDYLIVGDDTDHLRARKAWLNARGFSVADYTWKRLESQSDARTLFMLHLKLEARISVDTAGRLSSLLQAVEPKSNYAQDFRESLALFEPLNSIPNHPRGFAWAADTLAVAFRNSAILHLASEGEFCFSMSEILERLRIRGLINAKQHDDLRSLRSWKAAYRSSTNFGLLDHEFGQAAGAVRSALQHEVLAETANVACLHENRGSSTNAYAYMRSLEAELISLPSALLRDPKVRRLQRVLMRYLSDPHAYLWSFMNSSECVAAPLAELRSCY
jgi:hypothetical protein